jgi:DNA-nicking Smr family endonuclease
MVDAQPIAKDARATPLAGEEKPPPVPRKKLQEATPGGEAALAPGAAPGLDRRSAERLRRGQMTIEAVLDLHGHRQEEAHRELADFLARGQGAGRRCVLVITGTGRTKEGGGILRRELPRWLNEAPNRARVLAFAPAQIRHGGAGAVYILLRKAGGGRP